MKPPNSLLAGTTDALGGDLRPCASVAATDPLPARAPDRTIASQR